MRYAWQAAVLFQEFKDQPPGAGRLMANVTN
jgi:hypothetical protein